MKWQHPGYQRESKTYKTGGTIRLETIGRNMSKIAWLWTVKHFHGLSWTVIECHGLSWTILDWI